MYEVGPIIMSVLQMWKWKAEKLEGNHTAKMQEPGFTNSDSLYSYLLKNT